MKKLILYALSLSMLVSLITAPAASAEDTASENAVSWTEDLDRGLVAVPVSNGMYLSWRLQEDEDKYFGSADDNVSFDIYRDGKKIATESNTTNYIDAGGSTSSLYAVVPSGADTSDYTNKVISTNGSEITVNVMDKAAKVYAAKYDGGALEKIQVFDVEKTGESTFDAGFVPDKVFIWNGMTPVENMIVGDMVMMSDGYLTIPLDKPADMTLADGKTYPYTANDASCGDVDGDGEYEIIMKWDCNGQDNSQVGYTGNVLLDAYKLDGTRLWRIDLGQNIRAGAHYTQFLVYDFDNDGKAELACKTAPGSKDSAGEYVTKASHVSSIASVTDAVNETSYVNNDGRILTGAEYYTVFDDDGTAIDTIEYPFPRGNVGSWGSNESYGNRVDRFLGAVAYLDGVNPYIISLRGYYAKTTVAAMLLKDGQLSVAKTFTTDTAGTQYEGNGNHNITVADVDNDGKDEVITGAICWDDDLSIKWCSGRGHGDALHIGDYDPTHEGLEYFSVHESGNFEIKGSTTSSKGQTADFGMTVYDAANGEELFHAGNTKDTGRGMMANVGAGGYYQINGIGNYISNGGTDFTQMNSAIGNNFRIFWDGDLYDELLNGASISSWNGRQMADIFNASGCLQINGSKANPSLQADLFGDWREEVVYPTSDNTALRVYTSTTKTNYKIKSLMYDKIYREGVAAEQTGYNQPPHIGFYLSEDGFYGKMTDIELDTSKVKTTYHLGDELDTSGLAVTGKYSDAADKTLTAYSVSGYDPLTAGVQTIKVNYLKFSKYYDINVTDETGITAETTKTDYKVGEEIDKSMLTVKLHYADETEKTVTGYKLSGYDNMTVGAQTVTVSFAGAAGEVYTDTITVNVTTDLTIENGVVTGYSGSDTELVIPTSTADGAVTEIAGGAFTGSSLEKIYIYSKDIALNGDDIFPDGITIVCLENSKAYEYATAHNITVEIIKTGDSVTFDENFYTTYENKNMLMQGSSDATLRDDFITYNTHSADSRAPWYAADTYGFKIVKSSDNNYLSVNAGIYDDQNKFNQVYITLNSPKPVSESQTIAFDIMFPSNSGSPYVEIQNSAGTVIDTIQGLTADKWYRYELTYNGGYTRAVYERDGGTANPTNINVTASGTIASSIAFKQGFNMQGGNGGVTGIVNIDNILLN